MLAVPNYAVLQRSMCLLGKESRFPEGPIREQGVTVEPTTEYIYVTNLRNGLIHILSQTGDHINNFRDPYLTWPWGIVIHQDNIYVTDMEQHATFLFRLPDLKMIKKVGKRGSGREEFGSLKQLAISPNQHLYLAITNK